MPTNPDVPDENYRNLVVAVIRNGLQENGYLWLHSHEADIWCGMVQIDRKYLERMCVELGAPPRMRVIVSANGRYRKFLPLDHNGDVIEGDSIWSRVLREEDYEED